MAIANKTTPKNFLIAANPVFPSLLSIHPIELRTVKTITTFINIPIKISQTPYTERSEIMVVRVPDPAISGKASGTKLPEWLSSGFDLNRLIPNIISMARMKITIDPARAKDLTSIPTRCRNVSPAKRKNIINIPAETEAIKGLKFF